jgi:hypothetical protein
VVLSGEDFNESQNVAIAGKKNPEKTPMNIARNIQRVRYLSKNLSLGFILLQFENLEILSQQQLDFESEQPQAGSVFLSIPLIIPAAQPTPELTVIASTGQFNAHAPHSMQ